MPPEYFTFARLLVDDKYSLFNHKNQPNLPGMGGVKRDK
jgi:hypothetical protein